MATVSAMEVQVTQGDRQPDFTQWLSTLRAMPAVLLDLDRATTPGKNVPRPHWVVDDIRHEGVSFYVRVTAAPHSRGRDHQSLMAPVTTLVSGVSSLRRDPELPAFFSEDTVQRLLNVANPRDGIREVSVAAVNGAVGPYEALDEIVRENARTAVRQAEKSIGSITGRLTALNATSKGLRIALHDPVSRRTVKGTAPLPMKENLRMWWDHRVTLRGTITRNQAGQALKIAVRDAEPMPESVPTGGRIADQLYGADEQWTGGLSVDDYMSRVRRRA